MSRAVTYCYILFSSLVCFSLQFNLTSIVAFIHPHWTIIRLVPYFFLGCALAPLVLWTLERRNLKFLLPWLPPVILLFGLFVVFRMPSTPLCTVFILLAFSSVNACLLDALFRHSFRRAYLFDLIGGLAGFVIAIFLLRWLTGEGVFLFSLACSFVPPAIAAAHGLAKTVASICIALSLAMLYSHLTKRSFDLIQSRVEGRFGVVLATEIVQSQEGKGLLASSWSSIGRVDAVRNSTYSGLFYNNRLWSQISLPAGRKNKFFAPSPLWAGAQSGVVIGVGGGNDLWALRSTGVKQITGLEINPATIDIMQELGALNERIYSKVKIVQAEGRAYFENVDETYDLILLHAADLYSPQMQANVDLESFLYTKEAITTFWNHLTPTGTLIIEFGLYNMRIHSLNSVRLLHTMLDFLQSAGLKPTEHLMLLSHAEFSSPIRPKTSVFVLKKSPVTETGLQEYKKQMRDVKGVEWLTDGRTLGSESIFMDRCLNSIFNRAASPCPFEPALVNRDSYPFYNLSPELLAYLRIDYFIPLLAGLLLTLVYLLLSYRWQPELVFGVHNTTALGCGVIYGFLSPFLYYQFLLYSPSPLAVVALVQTGLLTASILANQFYRSAKNIKLMVFLLLLSLVLCCGLHFFRTDVISRLKPSQESYSVITFIVIFLVGFPMSLLFQGVIHASLNGQPDHSHKRAQLTFGLNMTGLSIGSFVSFIVNLFWGLHASFAIMAAVIGLMAVIRPVRK